MALQKRGAPLMLMSVSCEQARCRFSKRVHECRTFAQAQRTAERMVAPSGVADAQSNPRTWQCESPLGCTARCRAPPPIPTIVSEWIFSESSSSASNLYTMILSVPFSHTKRSAQTASGRCRAMCGAASDVQCGTARCDAGGRAAAARGAVQCGRLCGGRSRGLTVPARRPVCGVGVRVPVVAAGRLVSGLLVLDVGGLGHHVTSRLWFECEPRSKLQLQR